MTTVAAALDDLRRRRTEWAPWLAVVAEVVRETGTPVWDTLVPSAGDSRETVVPRLAGASLGIPAAAVRRFLERLIRIASRSDSAKMSTLGRALARDVDVLELFAASICQDGKAGVAAATVTGADSEALQAVVSLLPVPFLQACARRFAPSISPGWVQGYCPVCGSWPAFAEVRGIERTRSYRCGRCGVEWHARALCCPYCETDDHEELVELVPAKTELNGSVQACSRCRGYVKTFTRLQGCPADAVMLEDLASVELDVAALEHGYHRPPAAGYDVAIHVADKTEPRRLFRWTS